MAICPFGQGQFECKQTQCTLWDSENNQCSIITIRDYLKQVDDKLDTIDSRLFTDNMGDIADIQENSNKHLKSIDYHTRCSCTVFTSSLLLMNEFLSQKDLDGNGKVYGKDFRIVDAPPVLKALEDNPHWEDPPEVITMNDYVASLPVDDIEEWIVDEYGQIL